MRSYTFKVYDEPLQNYLDITPDLSEFIRSILDDYRTGKLSYTDENSISRKDQKLDQEILHLKLKNQLELKKQHNKSLDEIQEIMKNPSSFKIQENAEGLPCPECAWHTLQTNTTNEQINQITWHVKHFHNRNLSDEEAEKLSRLLI